MTPDALLARCADAGVSVHLDGDSVRMKGAREAVSALLDLMRENRAAVVAYLANTETPNLVAEFMETDGLSQADAEAIAAISIRPRSPVEWTALIADLDRAMHEYFDRFEIPPEQRARIEGARARQSLASIPASLAWFKCELLRGSSGPTPLHGGQDHG